MRAARFAGAAVAFFFGSIAYASDLDKVGVTVLRATTTNLDGTGMRIAQVEVPLSSNPSTWEVKPSASGVALPVSRFTYYATGATSTNFPNALGAESSHANGVAARMYGLWGGVSTNLWRMDLYEANYFYSTAVPALTPINARIVNQSFVAAPQDQQASDLKYDKYAAQYKTLFITGAGNGGTVYPPSTSYNGISVAAYGGASSVGPTADNGRAKPDITAPGDATSFSTPLVSGAAAILLQAGLRGDAGGNTNDAADPRTLKALLLNGAIKPADWVNPVSSPLDTRYGAGMLNVFNSYRQLTGGKNTFVASTSVAKNGPHPPTSATNSVANQSAWDYNTITTTTTTDAVNHYCFNLTNTPPGGAFTCTITLTWNRQFGQTDINDLDMYLYDMNSGAMVASSASSVDNVEHIFIPKLPPGRYDLEVLKHGGSDAVSATETYALAFEFFSTSLAVARSGTNLLLSWPVYPDGFVLESAPGMNLPNGWSTFGATPLVTNNQRRVLAVPSGTNQFFRLRRP